MAQELFTDAGFGGRLRDTRKIRGLTQEQLAAEMTAAGQGMHQTTIAKIESGDRPVSLSEAVHFARILKRELGDLASPPRSEGEQTLIDNAILAKMKVQSLERELAAQRAEIARIGRQVPELEADLSKAKKDLRQILALLKEDYPR